MFLASSRRFLAGRVFSSSSNSSSSLVTVEKIGRTAVVTLNNPSKLNALTVEMGDQFSDVIKTLSKDSDDIGAMVITGAGRAFSAGGDLEWLMDRHRDTPSRNSTIMRAFYSRFLSVRDVPFPVIAALNGPAIGAGCCLSLAADVRIAGKSAKLGLTFVGLGLHPGMGASHFLPGIVGPQQAAKMLLTGEVVNGERAEAMGLVAEAVDDDKVVQRALEVAEQMGSASPIAVRSCVRTLRNKQDEGLEQALWREADAQSYCYASKDLAEGVTAVATKRRPIFSQFEHYHDSKKE